MAKDKINEATTVASSRSRGGKFDKDKTKQSGQQAQDDFTNMIKKMSNIINAQLEVEPNANTINNIINKKDKKKMN
jgi:hypothetical protein|tara:strand:- start:945 stop:1172 length:228 start_codon:yes stop_codon:yes gene_type:complete